jgi:hypothetical protein
VTIHAVRTITLPSYSVRVGPSENGWVAFVRVFRDGGDVEPWQRPGFASEQDALKAGYEIAYAMMLPDIYAQFDQAIDTDNNAAREQLKSTAQ